LLKVKTFLLLAAAAGFYVIPTTSTKAIYSEICERVSSFCFCYLITYEKLNRPIVFMYVKRHRTVSHRIFHLLFQFIRRDSAIAKPLPLQTVSARRPV